MKFGQLENGWIGVQGSSYLLVLFAEILMMVSVCRAMAIHSEPPKIKQGGTFSNRGKMDECVCREECECFASSNFDEVLQGYI